MNGYSIDLDVAVEVAEVIEEIPPPSGPSPVKIAAAEDLNSMGYATGRGGGVFVGPLSGETRGGAIVGVSVARPWARANGSGAPPINDKAASREKAANTTRTAASPPRVSLWLVHYLPPSMETGTACQKK